MNLKQILDRFKDKREEEEALPDDVTRDKHLRSLRREMRVMNEEEEKKQLITKLAEIKKAKMRKHLFGIKDNASKQVDILRQDHKLMQLKKLNSKSSLLK